MNDFKIDIKDIRQSPEWGEYLKSIGWEKHKTSFGSTLYMIRSGVGTICKMQRPYNLTQPELDEIDKICHSKNAVFIKIEPSLQQDLELLTKNSYQVSRFPLIPPSTIYLNLAEDEKTLWDQITHSGKYSINRARRELTRTEILRNPSEEKLKIFHDLAIETGKKKKFYVQELNDLLSKAKLFGDNAYLIFVYDKDGVLASGKFYLGYNDVVWYLHGGTSEKGRKNKAGYELMWQSMMYFKQQGYRILDLEGVSDPRFPLYTHGWEGLTHFKDKFGGKLVRYPAPRVKLYNKVLATLSKFTGLNL